MAPAVEARSLNHWTAREVPGWVTVDGTCLKKPPQMHDASCVILLIGTYLSAEGWGSGLFLLFFPCPCSFVSNNHQEGVGCSFIIAISVYSAFAL